MLKFRLFRWLVVLSGLVLLATVPTALTAQTTAPFYYYQGTRVPLSLNPRLIAVRFNPAATSQTRRAAANATGDVDNFDASVASPIAGLTFVPLRPGHDPLAALGRFRTQPGVQWAVPVYDFGPTQLAETDEFLVRFRPGVTGAEIAQLNQQHNVTFVREQPYSQGVQVLRSGPGNPRSARELANTYFESGLTVFAEPDFVLRQARLPERTLRASVGGPLTPNDPAFSLQWALKNTRQFLGSIAGADINATPAWGVTQGATAIKIAIIDEGVTASHPDLVGKVLVGYNATDGTNNTTPKPDDNHGTAVAGLATANSNNGIGIAGVCWFCGILPVKVAETDAQGNWVTSTAILAAGIDWAWQHGADVLNNSWTMTNPSDTVLGAIVNARAGGRGGKGSTIIFAAGNQDTGVVAFPASLNSYVIAVGASNWCDQRKRATSDACNNGDASWGSNYGSALDLVAPGLAMYTTCNGSQCTNGSYSYLDGTSMAAPLVAGAAGLLYSLNPNLTPNQVQQMLQSGARDLGTAGRDDDTGYGRLDLYHSLRNLYNLSIAATDNRVLVAPGEVVTYTLSYANPGSTAMGSTVISVTVPAYTTYDSSTPPFTAQGGEKYALNLGTLASNATGTASFRVKVQPAAAGQVITLTATIAGAFPEATNADNTATDTSRGIQQRIYLPLLQFKSVP